MKDNQIYRLTGISHDTVHFYTRLGLLESQPDPENGHRLYDEATIRRVWFIQRAGALGFSLKQIGELLLEIDQGRSACADAREMLQQSIAQTREKLGQLESRLTRMEQAQEAWQSMDDERPNDHCYCSLIEKWDHHAKGNA